MTTIIPFDWGLSLKEFKQWCSDTSASASRVVYNDGSDRAEEFHFTNEQDLVAFKLTFKKRPPSLRPITGYRGRTTMDTARYYCPYIPKLK